MDAEPVGRRVVHHRDDPDLPIFHRDGDANAAEAVALGPEIGGAGSGGVMRELVELADDSVEHHLVDLLG
jgi:hypothetical protein